MDKVTFGENIKVTFLGGSHDEKMVVKISGFPSGVNIDNKGLCDFLDRRRPSDKYFGTARHEKDIPVIISGIIDGKTTGAEIVFEVRNGDVKGNEYEKYSVTPRPSHADYVSVMKYGKVFSGGGMFSGRMTLPICIAGYLAKSYLEEKNIYVKSFVKSIGKVERSGYDAKNPTDFSYFLDEISDEMIDEIKCAKESGDSVGGVVEGVVIGAPKGLGDKLNGGLENKISSLLFAIPAVKGVEFGTGFSMAKSKGSLVNDEFIYVGEDVRTISNNNGGINGGISNGMPIVVSVAIKPTPSISIMERTVNLKTKTNEFIKIDGRHDACIAVRAGVAVESMLALAILDEILGSELTSLRREIDDIDDEIVRLIANRMDVAKSIGEYKRDNNIPVTQKSRESEIIDRLSEKGLDKEDVERIYSVIFDMSKRKQ